MRTYRIIVILIILASIGLISIQETFADKQHADGYNFIEEKPYTDKPEFFTVMYESLGVMKVSWYGPRFHGRNTANGEIFDQTELSAAHKTLPFGTILRLTNPANKKSVVVRINDRGPFIEGRELDISKAAADSLGMRKRGVAKLTVDEIKTSDAGLLTQNN